MDIFGYTSLVGLLFAIFSGVTWCLFRPKSSFHAPLNRAMKITMSVLTVGTLISALLTLFHLFSPGIDSLFVSAFLVFTYASAAWHHVQHATRTPSDLWEKFFRG